MRTRRPYEVMPDEIQGGGEPPALGADLGASFAELRSRVAALEDQIQLLLGALEGDSPTSTATARAHFAPPGPSLSTWSRTGGVMPQPMGGAYGFTVDPQAAPTRRTFSRLANCCHDWCRIQISSRQACSDCWP